MCQSELCAIFARAKSGDRAAFDRLLTMHEGSVWRFVDRLIGPGAGTPDIVQKTFLALYLNIEKVGSVEHLLPFLYRVARNLCYDELRRRGRFDHVSVDAQGEAAWAWNRGYPCPAYVFDLPDAAAHFATLYDEVCRAMERLPELQRQTLILYAEEGLTYAQIAEVMSTDIGTVKSRIHNARKNLLKYLKPRFLEEIGVIPKRKENDDGRTKR